MTLRLQTAENRRPLGPQVGPEEAERERDRLLGLGAVQLRTTRDRGPVAHTLQDPQGNEFCVTG